MNTIYELFDSLELFGIKLGLAQTTRLFQLLGNPQNGLKFIHVAGSNGKGSVCAMIECALRHLGYRTGFYSSPHLVSVCERIRINGIPVSAQLFESYNARLQEAVELMAKEGAKVTYFEAMTALAAMIFIDANVDFVIWETGMGGRLDSTNIVTPLASVITGISLEHTAYLGNTIAKIASEKAGIIKPSVPVFTSPVLHPDALDVIHARAIELHAPHVIAAMPEEPTSVVLSSDRSSVTQKFHVGNHDVTLPLAGPHQRINASVAISVLAHLADLYGFNVQHAVQSLQYTDWPGRFQLYPQFGLIMDSAHNPEGIAALASTLSEVFPGQKFRVFFGAFSDKDSAGGLALLAPFAESFVFLSPDTARASWTPAQLTDQLRSAGINIPACTASIEEATSMLIPERPTLLCGSLHLCGDVANLLEKKSK